MNSTSSSYQEPSTDRLNEGRIEDDIKAWEKGCQNGTVRPQMIAHETYRQGFSHGVMSLSKLVERVGKQWKRMLRQQYKNFPSKNARAAAVAETVWNEFGFGTHYNPDPLYKEAFLAGAQAEFVQHEAKAHWWNTAIGFCLIAGLVNATPLWGWGFCSAHYLRDLFYSRDHGRTAYR
jgi:hypothetical protein